MDVKVSDAWIIHVERVCQRVHLCPWNGTQILDLVVAEVNFNIVYFQIACKNVSVVCQYVPSFRHYGVYSGKFPAGTVIPRPRLDHSGFEEHDHHQYAEEYEKQTYKSVSEQYVFFVILFHRLLVRKEVVPEIRGSDFFLEPFSPSLIRG